MPTRHRISIFYISLSGKFQSTAAYVNHSQRSSVRRLTISVSYLSLAAMIASRYNPIFLLPVSSTGTSDPAKITSWRRVGLTAALLASGTLPERSERGEPLDEALKAANGPCVVFPEASAGICVRSRRGLTLLTFLDHRHRALRVIAGQYCALRNCSRRHCRAKADLSRLILLLSSQYPACASDYDSRTVK